MMTDKVTARKPNEVFKGEKKVITTSERLFRRIDHEFGKKKLVGDIIINDSEFNILLEYFKIKTRALMTSYLGVIDDLRGYYNQKYHDLLKRKYVIEFIREILNF